MTMGAIQPQEVELNDEATLDALLGDLNLLGEEETPPPVEEIIEEGVPEIQAVSVEEIAAEEQNEPVDAPAAEIPDGEGVTAAEAPKKKGGSRKKKTEAGEPGEAKPKTERKFYANKVERITDKLGNKLGEYTVLELQDALLEGDALKAKQQETLDAIKTSGKKVQGRITFILEFIAGKSSKLNNVIVTAIKLLKSDGKITTGVEGNLYGALIARPYTPYAAKAMGGNTLLALKALKVIVPNEKGEYVANEQSLVLAKLNAMGVGA